MREDDKRWAKKLADHVMAGFQCILVPTDEEWRATQLIMEAARIVAEEEKCPCGVSQWDVAGKWQSERWKGPSSGTPTSALAYVATSVEGNELVVFKDAALLIDRDIELRRTIKSYAVMNVLNNKEVGRRPLILVQPQDRVHEEVEAYFTTLKLNRPNRDYLETIFDDFCKIGNVEPDAEVRWRSIRALQGMRQFEAEDVLSLCARLEGGLSSPELPLRIEEAKTQVIHRNPSLRYMPASSLSNPGDFAGYDALIQHVEMAALAMRPEAEALGLRKPKGIALVGVPGTGKTRFVDAVSIKLNEPLIDFDLNACKSGLVGSSEQNMRQALETIESIGPCVVRIDEADKIFSGADRTSGDSGVTRNLFRYLLTWMAERNQDAFIVMTMNSLEGVPSYLLRKGRLDEIFFVDIPDEEEREAIFRIHMKRCGIPEDADCFQPNSLAHLVERSEGMVGAEIEEIVHRARWLAVYDRGFSCSGIPEPQEFLTALEDVWTTAVTKIDPEGVEKMREFGSSRGRPVSFGKAKRVAGRAPKMNGRKRR